MAQKPNIRAQRKAERPAEILSAAFEEFVKNGYAATRLEDVAARAGVTKGTIYFYFDTKERVFDEMVRMVSGSFFSDIANFPNDLTGSHTSRLRALFGFFFKRIAEDRASREILRFLISEGTRFPGLVDRHYDEFVCPIIDQFSKLIRAGVESGEFRDCQMDTFTEIVMSPALLLSLWSMLFGSRHTIDVAKFTDASFDLLMNGLSQNSK